MYIEYNTLLPPVLWYSIGNWDSLSLAFHNLDIYQSSPSNSGVSVHLDIGQQNYNVGKLIKPDIRNWHPKITKLPTKDKLVWPTFLWWAGRCTPAHMWWVQIFLLLRRQRSNGFCGNCFCGFCGSYRPLASSADTWPARCAPKCQSLVDKQVDKKSLRGIYPSNAFLVRIKCLYLQETNWVIWQKTFGLVW